MLKSLETNQTLTSLYLEPIHKNTVVVDALVRVLNTNKTLTNLTLTFEDGGPTKEEMPKLAAALAANQSLRTLRIDLSKYSSDQTWESFMKEYAHNKTLIRLEMRYFNTSDTSFKDLMQMLQTNDNLQYIKLTYAPSFSDEEIDTVVAILKERKSLITLDFSDINISNQGKDKLQKAVSKMVKIIFNEVA